MSTFLSIRNYPAFRRYFDAVHPFFWPVLYWQLKRAWLYVQREKLTGALLAITWWGGVCIVCAGDKITPPDLLAPTRPHWSHPVWASDVPNFASDLSAQETLRLVPILPRVSGGGGSRLWREPPPNTS